VRRGKHSCRPSPSSTDRADPLFVAAATAAFRGGAPGPRGARQLGPFVHPRIGPRLAVGALGTGAAFWLLSSSARHASAIETTLCLQIEPVCSSRCRAGAGELPTARRLAAVALSGGIGSRSGRAGPSPPSPASAVARDPALLAART
jgi:hypothetical protein